MKKPKFLRRNWNKYKRLGLRNKKKQKWQRPRGKHSKMRKLRRGYSARVEVGYRSSKKGRGSVQGLQPLLVQNVQDLKGAGKEHLVIIAHVGKKKREAILKKAQELKLKIREAK